jgi:hypothetical protein
MADQGILLPLLLLLLLLRVTIDDASYVQITD